MTNMIILEIQQATERLDIMVREVSATMANLTINKGTTEMLYSQEDGLLNEKLPSDKLPPDQSEDNCALMDL